MTQEEWEAFVKSFNSKKSVFFDNEKIIKRIEVLLQRTIENGCVEAEELEASKKINEILIKHNLILIDTKIYKELPYMSLILIK